jgi:hypothetical protein
MYIHMYVQFVLRQPKPPLILAPRHQRLGISMHTHSVMEPEGIEEQSKGDKFSTVQTTRRGIVAAVTASTTSSSTPQFALHSGVFAARRGKSPSFILRLMLLPSRCTTTDLDWRSVCDIFRYLRACYVYL